MMNKFLYLSVRNTVDPLNNGDIGTRHFGLLERVATL